MSLSGYHWVMYGHAGATLEYISDDKNKDINIENEDKKSISLNETTKIVDADIKKPHIADLNIKECSVHNSVFPII